MNCWRLVQLGLVLSLSLAFRPVAVVESVVPDPESYPNRYRGNSQKHIVIIGAGPTGLGAAWRLHELGYTNWTLIEATQLTGGLAKSQTDPNGFTWDHGVHVLFSHYRYFDSLLDYVLPESEWFHHERYSPAWMRGRFVDYPVQNNCWQLPKNDTLTCLSGLSEAARSRGSHGPPANFDEWVVQGFGEGLANIFMRPYNFKVWAHPTHELNVQWVGERVATIDVGVILKHMIYELPDRQWGPNARFRYPARGSGQIWQSLFELLPSAHVALGKRVIGIETADPGHKRLVFDDNTALSFDALLSTLPLDKLLTLMVDDTKCQSLAGSGFKHQTVNLVGIGIDGPVPPHLNATYWVYFPEEEYVFYRLTVLSNFSPYMVPKPGLQYSILVEVSESKYRKVNHDTLVDDVLQGLYLCGFVSRSTTIVDRWQERFEYGYPVPYVGRDKHVHTADLQLRKHNIWSRGRFGSWKYEVANQDHSLMLGVEAIDNMLFGTEEVTYHKPEVANAGKGEGRHVNPPIKHKQQTIKHQPVESLDVSSAPRFYTVDDALMQQVSRRVVSLAVPVPGSVVVPVPAAAAAAAAGVRDSGLGAGLDLGGQDPKPEPEPEPEHLQLDNQPRPIHTRGDRPWERNEHTRKTPGADVDVDVGQGQGQSQRQGASSRVMSEDIGFGWRWMSIATLLAVAYIMALRMRNKHNPTDPNTHTHTHTHHV